MTVTRIVEVYGQIEWSAEIHTLVEETFVWIWCRQPQNMQANDRNLKVKAQVAESSEKVMVVQQFVQKVVGKHLT